MMVTYLLTFALAVAQQVEEAEPAQIFQKVLATYAAARTYQSTWNYTLTRGNATQEMDVEVRAKAPDRILFRVSLPKGKKPAAERPVPELLVVVDGRTAWYQNTTDKTYFKVPLPKDPKYTPLMFFPQMPTAGPIRRVADVSEGERRLIAIEADRREGGTIRMEIDAATYRVHRIVDTTITAFITTTSTITVRQESFDEPLDDKAFVYKPPRGFKEVEAPPGAGAIFGA